MMSDQGEISWPEQSRCARCGRELEPGAGECPACYGAAGSQPPTDVFYQIESRLRRTRGRILIGLFWLGFPLLWAVTASRAALRLYEGHDLEDPSLRARILRHFIWSVLSAVLWLTWFSFWAFYEPSPAPALSTQPPSAVW